MDAGEDVLIVDLRHSLDFDANPETIPGALHVDAADLEEAYEVIPRDREIVLFCALPERSDRRAPRSSAAQQGNHANPSALGRLRGLAQARLPHESSQGRNGTTPKHSDV